MPPFQVKGLGEYGIQFECIKHEIRIVSLVMLKARTR